MSTKPVRMWCIEYRSQRTSYLEPWTIGCTRKAVWSAYRLNCIDDDQFRRARKNRRAVRVLVTPEAP